MPTLNPNSLISELILPATGTHSQVLSSLAYGIYTSSAFISGAVDMVAYVYQRLGGNILDLEIQPSNVYNNYESAVLRYSEIINNHQAKSILFSMLGFNTATFDQDGTIISGTGVSLLYAPPVSFGLSRQIGYQYANEAGIGGTTTIYSGSFPLTESVQDYNLQEILQSDPVYSGIVGTNKIIITEVFYKNSRLQWRYYGGYFGNYGYGGMGAGGFAGNTSMYLVPTWEDKLRAMQYEDALNVRVSNYGYQLKNNIIRIFPKPTYYFPERMWFRFYVMGSSIDSLLSSSFPSPYGINGYATLPLINIPFENINSPVKHFIREYALALCKETLGRVRSKVDRIPIPGDHVKLDGPELLAEAKGAIADLNKTFLDYLDKVTNEEIAKRNEALLDADMKLKSRIPCKIWMM